MNAAGAAAFDASLFWLQQLTMTWLMYGLMNKSCGWDVDVLY
jgi:hypothetical protein